MSDPIAPMGEPTAKTCAGPPIVAVRTRKAIREAFFKLMENQDYHKITIASVARPISTARRSACIIAR